MLDRPVKGFPLPAVIDPPKICIQFEIPNEQTHIANFLGNLLNLAYWFSYQRDDAHTGLAVSQVWFKVYDQVVQAIIDGGGCVANLPPISWEEPDMTQLRVVCESNKAYLEFLECACPEKWVRLANIDQVPLGGQSGTGQPQPQPGGGRQTYCNALEARGILYMPTSVSTGDTIKVTTASGAAYDGAFGAGWTCPDGSTYFGGNCLSAPPPHTDPTDPVPTANHMSIIAKIGTNFYALPIGTLVTVSSGISNASVLVQVNDANLSDNDGEYQLCIEITNNQAASWSKSWDFQTLNFPWTYLVSLATNTPLGHYSPGTGFVSDWNIDGAGGNNLDIVTPAVGTYTSFSFTVDTDQPMLWSIRTDTDSHGSTGTVIASGTTSGLGTQVLAGVIASASSSANVTIGFFSSGAGPGTCILSQLTLGGTGANPFS